MKEIRKAKSLTARLREMPIGSEVSVRSAEYKVEVVRKTVYRLNAAGMRFEVTERGLVNECRVTRLA